MAGMPEAERPALRKTGRFPICSNGMGNPRPNAGDTLSGVSGVTPAA